mmetsp:Transcript_18556/g.56031  ORF Transcript_18556/g.56031 Transcript_18556/m.56031 type:complete len:214 (+) Transcript_18556:1972-2613(+)
MRSAAAGALPLMASTSGGQVQRQTAPCAATAASFRRPAAHPRPGLCCSAAGPAPAAGNGRRRSAAGRHWPRGAGSPLRSAGRCPAAMLAALRHPGCLPPAGPSHVAQGTAQTGESRPRTRGCFRADCCQAAVVDGGRLHHHHHRRRCPAGRPSRRPDRCPTAQASSCRCRCPSPAPAEQPPAGRRARPQAWTTAPQPDRRTSACSRAIHASRR